MRPQDHRRDPDASDAFDPYSAASSWSPSSWRLLGFSLVASLRHIRGDLVRGRSAAEHGRSQLLAGDAVAAAESLREARESFAGAAGRTDGLLFRVAGWLPIVGRTTDAVEAVAGSAVDATDAVIVLADAAADIPGDGLSGLAPSDGRVPLDRSPHSSRPRGKRTR